MSTFVYVSNAEDGDIGTYVMNADGSLVPGPRVKADKGVMPMSVSPDSRHLVAAARGQAPSDAIAPPATTPAGGPRRASR